MSAGRFVSIDPHRVLDTRPDQPGPVPAGWVAHRPSAGSSVVVEVPDDAEVPSSGVSALVVNVTATEAVGPGFLQALPTGATPATTVTYSTGDIIQAMWLGQQVTGGTTGGAQLFGTQSYTVNPTTTATSVSYSDQTSVGPFNWDPVFGAAPSF